MAKILDNVYHELDDCEIRFTSCFTTMFMKTENMKPNDLKRYPGWCQRFLHRCNRCGDCCGKPQGEGGFWLGNPSLQELFGIVSGIPFVQPDLSTSPDLEFGIERSFTRVVEEFDDYISFLCKFAGYTHSEIKIDKGKDLIFSVVKQAIDNDKAAMIQFTTNEDWAVVVGYDDNRLLYIMKWETAELTEETFDESTYCSSDWFENLKRILVLEEKKNYNITSKAVFSRLYKLMRRDYDLGSFQNSIKYLRNNDYFMNLDDAGLFREQKRFKNFWFGRVINRCIADWYFNNPYELNRIDWGDKFHEEYKWLSLVCAINHDLGDIYGELDKELKNNKIRTALAHTTQVAFINNCKIMSLIKQISEK